MMPFWACECGGLYDRGMLVHAVDCAHEGGRMVIYQMVRRDGMVRLYCDGREITPERSLRLRSHSPTGFEIGYHGSGPSQAALAILVDYLDDADRALSNYQRFKAQFIANVESRDMLVIPSMEIDRWLAGEDNYNEL